MEARAEREDSYPYRDLSNFTAWYRHLVQSAPRENAKLLDSLRAVLDDFSFLELERAGENTRELFAEFATGLRPSIKLGLNKLSDGQRCLIGLYTILHFVLSQGNTVILDEPDNFVSLREIQPWLNAVSDTIDECRGQVLLISHHPELLNQWAPSYGVRFVREGMGPVRVKKFQADPRSHFPHLRLSLVDGRRRMSKPSKAVILARGSAHPKIVLPLLSRLPQFKNPLYDIRGRIAPAGQGSGEQWVRERYRQ